MLSLQVNKGKGLNLLCMGAHCDDIEIGCGGTLLKMISEYDIGHIRWVVFTSTPERKAEAQRSADFFLMNVPSHEIIVKDFKDGVLPQHSAEVKAYFERMKTDYHPDVVFTHYRHDLHQDHRVVNELTWNTFRNHFILEYEIQKYDGDLGNPGLYVPLDEEIVNGKIKALMEYFPSQASKHWFDRETFLSLMRIRGIESACRYAEAFYMRKGIL